MRYLVIKICYTFVVESIFLHIRASFGVKSTKSGSPENMGTAVGIASLTSLERAINYFWFGGCHILFPVSTSANVDINFIKPSNYKSMRAVFGISSLSFIQRETQVVSKQ
jgi:hypothetical protein